MKKVIFVDRDGTILVEPKTDYQVDSLEDFKLIPGVVGGLKSICSFMEADGGWELVLASNQNGLGLPCLPWEDFIPPHRMMVELLEGEGIVFDEELIDGTLPEEKAPTRKPGTGMFGRYMGLGAPEKGAFGWKRQAGLEENTDCSCEEYDLAGSYVIGDRTTDVQLAKNLGAKAIMILADPGLPEELGFEKDDWNSVFDQRRKDLEEKGLADSCVLMTHSWDEIAAFIRTTERTACVERKTKETDIRLRMNLDGVGESGIDTGLNFFDHMLDQLVHHGGIALSLSCKGDLEVDEHHTIEDVGIALGEALKKALGNKRGIDRYGFVLPMDESRATVLIDFGGRSELVWDVEFTREYVGDVPTEMLKHFFKAICSSAACNMYIEAHGENNHHIAEAIFKAFARAIRQAVRRDVFNMTLPSSKGTL